MECRFVDVSLETLFITMCVVSDSMFVNIEAKALKLQGDNCVWNLIYWPFYWKVVHEPGNIQKKQYTGRRHHRNKLGGFYFEQQCIFTGRMHEELRALNRHGLLWKEQPTRK